MLQWQGSIQANPDPQQASPDIRMNPDQFTDVIPELQQLIWGGEGVDMEYSAVYLGAYAVPIITSAWLPMLTPINHAPAFAVCNLRMLAITGTGSILAVLAWDLQEELDIPYLLLVRLVQIVCAAALVEICMWKVHEHNLTHCEPDAMHSLYSPLQPPESLRGIRYIDRGGLVEQQAALFHYQLDNLQHHNQEFRLCKRSIKNEQAQDGGTTPLVYLKHLLDTKEQELRAIAAEDEIRVARSIIGGRESDLLAVRSENDKYVEENEGLGAELDEWSARTAKVSRLDTVTLIGEKHEIL